MINWIHYSENAFSIFFPFLRVAPWMASRFNLHIQKSKKSNVKANDESKSRYIERLPRAFLELPTCLWDAYSERQEQMRRKIFLMQQKVHLQSCPCPCLLLRVSVANSPWTKNNLIKMPGKSLIVVTLSFYLHVMLHLDPGNCTGAGTCDKGCKCADCKCEGCGCSGCQKWLIFRQKCFDWRGHEK